jgi:hypothetical protein
VKKLGAVDFIDRNEFTGMMRGETPEEKGALQGVAQFRQEGEEILGDSPDIVFEHVLAATFPTSVSSRFFGKVVICATSGYTLDFDVRYLWMRRSRSSARTSPTRMSACAPTSRWPREDPARAMEGDGLRRRRGGAPATHENKHLGKIRSSSAPPTRRARQRARAIRAEVGCMTTNGRIEVIYIDWHVPVPPSASTRSGSRGGLAMAFGAMGWSLSRSRRTRFRQASIWDSREDFELLVLRRGRRDPRGAVNCTKAGAPVWHALVAGK